jgi:hypothetical protein
MPRKIVIIYELSIENAGQGSTLCASRERRHACLEQRFSPPDAQIVRPGPLLEAFQLSPTTRHGRGGVVKQATESTAKCAQQNRRQTRVPL